MSLFSILSNTDSTSSSVSSSIQLLLQQVAAKQGTDSSSSTTDSTSGTDAVSSVLITLQAQRAAADQADADKDAATLAKDTRAALDAQYKEKGSKEADMGAFSNRALSQIALNENGSFSKAEVAQAKSELRERDRQSLMQVINAGPLTSSTLTAYARNMTSARSTMSAEERMLRDSNPDWL